MIVTCDNCSTSFNVPESAIGEHGRFVRCSKCGHEWVATLPRKPFHLDQEIIKKEIVPPPPPLPDKNLSEVKELKQTALSPKASTGSEVQFDLNALRPKKVTTPEITPPQRKKTFFFYSLLLITLIAALLLTGVSLLVYRDAVIKKLPSLEKMYKKVGVYNYSNLIFDEVNCQIVQQTSTTSTLKTQAVDINLRVKNTGSTTQRLSYIKITTFDKKMNKLGDFKVKQMKAIKPNKEQLINIAINAVSKKTRFISVEMGNYPDFYLYNSKYIKTFISLK
ncbi:zinc-ribbon domain-containing protein [Candidatus Jidaibacter acanthamoebae]|nr:zinc-ribbon domain-containing protein [Candidatus Jidaibacter acanthamoeba]